MNELTKHPAMLVGAVVLVIIAVAIAGKQSGPAYAVQSGPTGADIKARADAQASTDKSLNDQRQTLLTGLLGYDKQRMEFQTSILKIRTDADVTRHQTDAGVKLGLAGIESGERLGMRQADSADKATDSQERVANRQEDTKQQNGILGFFGNLFGGVISLITGGFL